ncbi:hypothetical protein JYT85_01435 [Desulfocapsa sp. AH-315-G09]|uniref:Uncharacterized protein n=1 Tax=Desulfotalea psychrophila TaxID=84980 RepID=A0ABS3ATI2_9BACT|nr:hypothetical protein [Desulfocapsa sp.]MBN4065290.1 hypothetical protein [Desulfocapsa sp. AH-315-G09]MBN4068420.1 hypothetical protein [Desulfotalea psychrophila]
MAKSKDTETSQNAPEIMVGLSGCKAYGAKDLCPVAWCRKARGDWCKDKKGQMCRWGNV